MKQPADDPTRKSQNLPAEDPPFKAGLVEETLVRFTLDLPEGLHREFKMAAVSEGRSMRALALEWVRAGVDEINATAKKR